MLLLSKEEEEAGFGRNGFVMLLSCLRPCLVWESRDQPSLHFAASSVGVATVGYIGFCTGVRVSMPVSSSGWGGVKSLMAIELETCTASRGPVDERRVRERRI